MSRGGFSPPGLKAVEAEMEREQELKKLINVLHRTARSATRVQWMNAGEGETRFAVSQFNKILARLGELDPNVKNVFEKSWATGSATGCTNGAAASANGEPKGSAAGDDCGLRIADCGLRIADRKLIR